MVIRPPEAPVFSGGGEETDTGAAQRLAHRCNSRPESGQRPVRTGSGRIGSPFC